MKAVLSRNAKICFFSTALFSLAANAFAYFNLTPHHDAIHHTLLFSDNNEISIGRFLHPVWGKLIGDIAMPWFAGLLSILFLSISVWLCIEILNIKSTPGIIITAGFLSINYSITELCGTFGYVLGCYTFALMLIFAAVWVVKAYERNVPVLIAAVLVCLSMGLYPAYVTVGFTLFLILLMQHTVACESVSSFFRKHFRLVAAFIIGAVLYFIIYRLVLSFTGIEAKDVYSSPSQLSKMSFGYLRYGAVMVYKGFLRFMFLNKAPSTWLIAIINLILFVTTVVVVVRCILRQKEAKTIRTVLFFICIILFPLAACSLRRSAVVIPF